MISKYTVDEIYNSFLERDFPKNELRDLKEIKRLYKKGNYSFHGSFENCELRAYAAFLSIKKNGPVLLDYFAVEPKYRGEGYGGTFLKKLTSKFDIEGFFIECENPEKAETEKEKETRVRRIDFYKKHGAILTKYSWTIRPVNYLVLWLPIKKDIDKIEVKKELRRIYRLTHGYIVSFFISKFQKLDEETYHRYR